MTASPEAPTPAAEAAAPRRRGRRLWLLLGLLPLLALGYVGWLEWREHQHEVWDGEAALAFDPERPDALIESQSLAALPRDLLRAPLLRELLSEDFVFYYEHNADRLGVAGALRRIAYEHELDWSDRLLAELLDQPAQLALWRSADGALGHALLSLERGALAKLLAPLVKIAADDRQLAQVGNLEIEGEKVAVYRLRYGWQRALLFAGHGERLRVLVSPSLLGAGDSVESGLALLDAAIRQSPQALPARFALKPLQARHRLVFSADYLALGYGRLLPQVAGLRIELRDERWQGFAALNPVRAEVLDFAPLWQAAPHDAAACVAAPLSSAVVRALLKRLGPQESIPERLQQRIQGPLALCWSAQSRLYTPLLITRLSPSQLSGPAAAEDLAMDPRSDAQILEHLFTRLIGTGERELEGKRWPVQVDDADGHPRWQRAVSSIWGLHGADEAGEGEPRDSGRFLRVAMALQDSHLLFSLDARLVAQAQATLDKRFPPLADRLPSGAPVPLYVAPERLSLLLEQETLASLPADVEAVFRNAAEAHLLPKLRAAAAQPPQPMRTGPGCRSSG
jgi:uncharacterized protein YfaA (DUF2138 family)